jgi:Bifunctional DNA primase/polymerase, N-terminal
MTTRHAPRCPRLSPGHAALHYAARGLRVLPLHTPQDDGSCSCRRPGCPQPGKHPRTPHGLRDASRDPRRLAAWWRAWPDANIGIVTGRLVVVDVDGDAGDAALARFEAAHAPLPATLECATARGRHLYFDAGARAIANSVAQLGGGLDVRGRGGYAIAPPSRHADGPRYRWRTPRPAAALPRWLAELLVPAAPARPRRADPPRPDACDRSRRYFAAALRGELSDVAGAQPGTRNNTLNRAAFRLAQLAAGGHGELAALPAPLLDAALAVGLSESEALATIASALRAGHQHPRPAGP